MDQYLHSFIWLNNIPMYGYISFNLSIHHMMDNWVVFTLGLSCLHKHLCTSLTWMYKNLAFNFLGYICLGVKLLGYTATLYFNFWETANVSKATEPFYISTSNRKTPASSYPHQHLLLSFFYYRHSSRYEVVCHCGFHLYFPDD